MEPSNNHRPREGAVPRPTQVRAAAVLVLFGAALLMTAVAPWCMRDRVTNPHTFVAALHHARGSVESGDVVLVHPPWRHDVVDAIRDAQLLPPDVRITTALSKRHGAPWPNIVFVADDAFPLPRALAQHLADTAPLHHADGVRILRRAGTSVSAWKGAP